MLFILKRSVGGDNARPAMKGVQGPANDPFETASASEACRNEIGASSNLTLVHACGPTRRRRAGLVAVYETIKNVLSRAAMPSIETNADTSMLSGERTVFAVAWAFHARNLLTERSPKPGSCERISFD